MSEQWTTSEDPPEEASSYAARPSHEWARTHGDPVEMLTISREFGAGGSDLARVLGAKLQWPVLDRDLVHLVAERLHLEPRHIEPLDEQCPSLFARLVSSAVMMTPPEVPVDVESTAVLNPDAVAEAARAAMLAAAQRPPVIIVGHGAQALFRGRTGALHVRLVAPLDVRLDRICGREGCNRPAAATIARRIDDVRRAYVRRYYHVDVRDPCLYDLQFNTGHVRIEEIADFLGTMITARRGALAEGR